MPDLAIVVPAVFNSKLARNHASDKDPWAMEWMKTNDAGGGAYKLERWVPGQETAFIRLDEWKSGPLPKIRRIVLREVPAAGNRRALMERGDADLSIDMPFKDASEIKKSGAYRVVGMPVENSLQYVGLVAKMKPFDDVRVRQAIAWAVPYEEIYKSVVYDICIPPMSGGPRDVPKTAAWPRPFPTSATWKRPRRCLPRPGLQANSRRRFRSISATPPNRNLPQSSFRIRSANWASRRNSHRENSRHSATPHAQKNRPIHIASYGGWLNYPDYYFF